MAHAVSKLLPSTETTAGLPAVSFFPQLVRFNPPPHANFALLQTAHGDARRDVLRGYSALTLPVMVMYEYLAVLMALLLIRMEGLRCAGVRLRRYR